LTLQESLSLTYIFIPSSPLCCSFFLSFWDLNRNSVFKKLIITTISLVVPFIATQPNRTTGPKNKAAKFKEKTRDRLCDRQQ
jgi:hypothetical protein